MKDATKGHCNNGKKEILRCFKDPLKELSKLCIHWLHSEQIQSSMSMAPGIDTGKLIQVTLLHVLMS